MFLEKLFLKGNFALKSKTFLDYHLKFILEGSSIVYCTRKNLKAEFSDLFREQKCPRKPKLR